MIFGNLSDHLILGIKIVFKEHEVVSRIKWSDIREGESAKSGLPGLAMNRITIHQKKVAKISLLVLAKQQAYC